MNGATLHDATPALSDRRPDAGTDNRPAEEPTGWLWLRDPALAALVLLPLALLTLDSDWIFSGPHRDAWIYYGYYQNALLYLHQFPDLYYGSRLAVILPGFLVHHLLPPVAANVVLHLALYWSAVLSFYLAAKEMFGSRVALLTGLALGCHPYFLQAAGWNYVDGFGISYFLTALLLLTRAAASPSWRPLLLAAGALATAIVSTNVFYAVYLPLLAGYFLVLNRQRRCVPLAAVTLWAGLGAVGLFALFGSFTWWLNGSFFYLSPSLQFMTGTLGTANPFRDTTYKWLPNAVWLVFPAIVLLNSAIVLGRAWLDPLLRRNRLLLWSQVQFVFLALLMLFLQLAGNLAMLEYFYYATLLIPTAFLAFAGQVSQVMGALPGRRFSVLAAAVALLQIAPLCVPIYTLVPTTALLALSAGLGTVLILARKTAGTRPVLLVFFCLALCQLLVRQGGSIFWSFVENYNSDGRGLYEQLSRAMTGIESFDPSQQARLWYALAERGGGVYDAVASAFLLCPRMINFAFPDLSDGRMCDGVQLEPGVPIAILSADPAAFEKADAAIRGIGLSAHFVGREEIEGPSRGFAITYLRTKPGRAP